MTQKGAREKLPGGRSGEACPSHLSGGWEGWRGCKEGWVLSTEGFTPKPPPGTRAAKDAAGARCRASPGQEAPCWHPVPSRWAGSPLWPQAGPAQGAWLLVTLPSLLHQAGDQEAAGTGPKPMGHPLSPCPRRGGTGKASKVGEGLPLWTSRCCSGRGPSDSGPEETKIQGGEGAPAVAHSNELDQHPRGRGFAPWPCSGGGRIPRCWGCGAGRQLPL